MNFLIVMKKLQEEESSRIYLIVNLPQDTLIVSTNSI